MTFFLLFPDISEIPFDATPLVNGKTEALLITVRYNQLIARNSVNKLSARHYVSLGDVWRTSKRNSGWQTARLSLARLSLPAARKRTFHDDVAKRLGIATWYRTGGASAAGPFLRGTSRPFPEGLIIRRLNWKLARLIAPRLYYSLDPRRGHGFGTPSIPEVPYPGTRGFYGAPRETDAEYGAHSLEKKRAPGLSFLPRESAFSAPL